MQLRPVHLLDCVPTGRSLDGQLRRYCSLSLSAVKMTEMRQKSFDKIFEVGCLEIDITVSGLQESHITSEMVLLARKITSSLGVLEPNPRRMIDCHLH